MGEIADALSRSREESPASPERDTSRGRNKTPTRPQEGARRAREKSLVGQADGRRGEQGRIGEK